MWAPTSTTLPSAAPKKIANRMQSVVRSPVPTTDSTDYRLLSLGSFAQFAPASGLFVAAFFVLSFGNDRRDGEVVAGVVLNAATGTEYVAHTGPRASATRDGSPWAKDTLVLVTWDESGGYYDHVAPPAPSTSTSRPASTSSPGRSVEASAAWMAAIPEPLTTAASPPSSSASAASRVAKVGLE